ncbi:MAG: hypothetical protein ACKOXV_03065, partial [Bacteroidota bacterium]
YSYATPDIYIDGVLNNGVEVFRPGTEANPIAGDDFTATPIIYTLVTQNPLHADGFSIVNDYGASGDNITKADIKLYSGLVSNPILMGTETIDNMVDVSSTTRYPFSKGYDNITSIKIFVYKTLPAGTQNANGMQMGELGLYSNAGTFCGDLDTDSDGISNRLDLDSDGDGCSDASEAGVLSALLTSGTVINLVGQDISSGTISSTLNNAIVTTFGSISATFGNNGFANAIETSSESGIYSGTYTYQFAKWKMHAGCIDTDGDGIMDITDFDDDNDGILDVVESPNCFSSIKDAVNVGAISSNLAQYSTYTIGQSIDNNASTLSAFATGQNWVGVEIFRITPQVSGPLKISSIQFDLVNWSISNGTTSTFKLQGSNNYGTSWTDLSAATYSTGITGTFTISNTLQSNTGYRLFRLVGVAGTSGYGGVTEIRLVPSSDFVPSLHQIYTCSLVDTDRDGIPNTLDLDADGDGCPDAKEASIIGTLTTGNIKNLVGGILTTNSNVASAVISSTYGANGFADVLETTTESGVYSGMYTNEFVLSSEMNACLDSDGDGINDIFDIDDDNDGILDTQEQVSCVSYGVNLDNVNFTGTSVISKTSNTITTNTPAYTSSYSNENFSLPLSLKFNRLTTDGAAMFGLIPSGNTQTPANYNDLGYKFNISTSQAYGYFNGGVWSFTHGTVTGSEEYSIDISVTGYVTVKINGVQKQAFQGTASTYKLAVTAGSSSAVFSNIRLTNNTFTEKIFCSDRDTDNDGIPNRLDLDSDGDGCSDAFEGGTTTSRSANFVHPTPYGNNGFVNALETVTDNGTYSGTYTFINVIDRNIKACLDTDGDNISDIIDIDDDNDGILDSEECNASYFDNWTDLASYKSKLISSAFHGTLFRSAKGNYYVAGQYAKPDGTDQSIPTLVTPANGYNFTGEIIDIAAVGANSCYVLTTTKGIWVWGYLNTNFVLPGTSNTAASPFQKVALPEEIDPKNIKSISASTNNFIILLQDGTVYTYGMANASINGAGLSAATKTFTKVLIAPNTPLTNIAQVEATSGGSIAADVTNNKLYTWGTNVYLGNTTAATTKNYANEMTNPLPSGVGIAMIDATYDLSMTFLSVPNNK